MAVLFFVLASTRPGLTQSEHECQTMPILFTICAERGGSHGIKIFEYQGTETENMA